MASPEMALPEPERFTAEYFQDPLAHLARLRESRPVAPVIMPDAERVWLITRYEDVRAALADARLSADVRKFPSGYWAETDPVSAVLREHMLNLDHPDHTRLRRLVTKAFNPRRIAELRPRITAITSALVGSMAGHDEADLIESFAFPLPVTVICELLGIPVADRGAFGAWSQAILSSAVSPQEFRSARAAMYGYVTELLDAKRREPSDDLLSALIAARDDADSTDRLAEGELIATLFLLLITGHEITVNLIGNGMLALLTHADQLARLREDPALIPAALDELVRFTGPLSHTTRRFTLEEMEIGGVTIPAWEWVLCVISSADRDPARFPDPDRLDLGRDTTGHLGFGHGIHHCLGMPLARLEGEIAFGALLARFPAMSLAVPPGELRWRQSSLIRGLETLPVRLR